MRVEITIRPTNEAEDAYTYTQSSEIQSRSGYIGYLRGYFDNDGKTFHSSWYDHNSSLRTDAFIKELCEIVNRLSLGEEDKNGIRHEDDGCFLKDRSAMRGYCRNHPLARMNGDQDQENYGFRIDTDDHTYMMRLNPNRGFYNLYTYCYRRDCLEQCLKQTEQTVHTKVRQKDKESER